jgi:polyisoprenoid-binding protein YceI
MLTKRIVFLLSFCLAAFSIHAQSKYFTKSGFITLNASSSLEKIEAQNKKATCVIDAKTGAVEIALLLKAFEFEQALMQEHFNENYVESDKYPKSTYKGKIENMADVDFSKDGSYPVKLTGQLTIHGVTKETPAKGKIIVKNGKINATSEFIILLSDFNIDIPGVVKDKISKTTKISASFWLDPLA